MQFSKFGSAEVLTDPSIAIGRSALARKNPTGLAITRIAARSLLWFIRKELQAGQLGGAAQYARMAVSLARSTPDKAA
jgi:hypothetical protein